MHTLPGVNVPYEDVDLVVVRENTEGLYSGQEHVVVPGVVESLRIITRTAAERIVRYAFELARHAGPAPRHVLPQGRRACRSATACSSTMAAGRGRRLSRSSSSRRCTSITLCLQLALDPTRFDVLVMENLFGDVISDLCAGLVGGLGLVPGANIGSRYAVFEAVHGSAPDIAGKGLANPIALIRSAAMMLEHIGQRKPAAAHRGVGAARRCRRAAA